MSHEAMRRYINPSSGRIKVNVLLADADFIPQRHRTKREFKASFGNVNHYVHDFSGYTIVVSIRYAFEHFINNTYSEGRAHLNATLLPTLLDPLIVVKSSYDGNDTLTFYKPFKSEVELQHMVMFHAYKHDDEKYYFKTIYQQQSLHKIDEIIRSTDNNTVYFKYAAEGTGS